MKFNKYIICIIILTMRLNGNGQAVQIIEKVFPATSKVKLLLGSRNLNVRTWDSGKIKIEIHVNGPLGSNPDGASNKTGFTHVMARDTLIITSGTPFSFDSFDVYALGLDIVPGKKFISIVNDKLYYYDGKQLITLDKALREAGKFAEFEHLFTKSSISVYIPKETELDIQNDFGIVNLEHDILKVRIKGNSIDMQTKNISNLNADLSYSTLNGGDFQRLNLKASGNKLFLGKVNEMQSNTSECTIELKAISQLQIEDKGDELRIGTAGRIAGLKHHGRLYIDTLSENIQLIAKNTDVRLRAFGPAARQVDITNKFGSLFLPVTSLSGYRIELSGTNVFTSGSPKFWNDPNSKQKGDVKLAVFGTQSLGMRLDCDYCTITF